MHISLEEKEIEKIIFSLKYMKDEFDSISEKLTEYLNQEERRKKEFGCNTFSGHSDKFPQ